MVQRSNKKINIYMLSSASELIEIFAGNNYSPTFVSTDKRVPSDRPTSLGYQQIGETQQYGFAKGPIFRIEVVDVSSVGGVAGIKVWGLDNLDDSAPIYPISYFTTNSKIDVYLKKFEFVDGSGEVVIVAQPYTIVGYKKKNMPVVW